MLPVIWHRMRNWYVHGCAEKATTSVGAIEVAPMGSHDSPRGRSLPGKSTADEDIKVLIQWDFTTSVVSIAGRFRLVMEGCIQVVAGKHIQDAFSEFCLSTQTKARSIKAEAYRRDG
jgi:hypothetical protein